MGSSAGVAAQKYPEKRGAASPSDTLRSATWQTLVCCLLLAFAVLVSYSGIRHNTFLNYDDDRYITDNPHVKAGLTWATTKWAFTTYDEANWAPLSWLAHSLVCQVFGLDPAAHHAVNVALHAANAILLFLLLASATGFRWRSLIVAAIFALHPINVESVAWAAELKNVLSMLFFLIALAAYVAYARKPGLSRYVVILVAFSAGLLSKSQVITFPFLAWLMDYWPLRRLPFGANSATQAEDPPPFWKRWLVLEKLPLLLLSAGSAVITMRAERAGGAVQSVARYSWALRLETAVISYARYLGNLLWPARLVALYPHATRLYSVAQVAAAVLLLLTVTATVLALHSRRYLVVGWLWFVGCMVPMIGLVQVGPQAMADRFAYIPAIGISIALTWLVADWVRSRQISHRWTATLVVGYLVVLGVLTYRQVGYWKDSATFWQRTVDLTSDNYIAENNLGDSLFLQGKADEAAAHFRTALSIRPDNLFANLNLASYEDSRGHFAEAMARYQAVISHTNDVDLRAAAYASMGFDYRGMARLPEAKQCFEKAVELAPHRSRAMVGLGLLAETTGDWSEAVEQYRRAADAHPTDVSFFLLARALQHTGREQEAQAASAHIEHPSEAKATAEAFLSGK